MKTSPEMLLLESEQIFIDAVILICLIFAGCKNTEGNIEETESDIETDMPEPDTSEENDHAMGDGVPWGTAMGDGSSWVTYALMYGLPWGTVLLGLLMHLCMCKITVR